MKTKLVAVVRRIAALLSVTLMKIRQVLSLRRRETRYIMITDILPILEAWGVKIKGQSVYEFTLSAKVNEVVGVTIKSYARVNTGDLKKICEQYELVKKKK